MANVLYPEDAVIPMLLAAYKAGFEGPMELAEDSCREILARATYKESDLEIIEFMQKRERKKQYEEGVEARKQASKRCTTFPAVHGHAAPDHFDEEEQLDV